MQINLVTLVGISLAAMFFGYFFGLFEGRGQGAKKRKAEEEAESSAKINFEPPLPPPGPVTPVENRLLAIRLDERNQPQLELDGQRVNAYQLAPEQRKRLVDLMLILRPWVESNAAQKLSIPAQPAPRPVTAPLPPPPALLHSPASPPSAAPAARQTPPSGVSPNTVPVPEPVPTSLVGQIDAILQARLIGTSLEEKGIRLVESIHGGALVFVGNKSYEGVGEVPDPEVQAAIRAATAEWEKRYTPGYR
jgi:hypothetical protein